MAENHIFPQNGDSDFAEDFAQMIGHSILADVVVTGMGFSEDFGVPEVTINSGLCFIMQDTVSVPNGETRFNTNRTVQLAQDTIALTSDIVNHIYVEPQFGTNDSPQYTAETDTSNASADALKIGEINTSENTSTTTNRSPNYNGNALWHEGNDGPGSGLDADTLDGAHKDDIPSASQNIVTSSRNTETWYQNTNNGPMMITVSAYDNTYTTISGYSNTTQSTTNARVAYSEAGENTIEDAGPSITFIVPENYYYRVDGAQLHEWTEWVLS